jgi:hypothetical protein
MTSLGSISIPPQIQITPNLSIPDLSQMQGDPIADDLQRSYEESVAKYASLTEEQRLKELKEKVQRHKLFTRHSDSEMQKFFSTQTSFVEVCFKAIFLVVC